jgi:hypothetical protein
MFLNNDFYNLYQPDAHYYWFGWQSVVEVDVLNNNDFFDLNDLLKSVNPKFISFKDDLGGVANGISIWNYKFFAHVNLLLWKKAAKFPEFRSKVMKNDHDFWDIDLDWIYKNYKKTSFDGLWVRIETL